MMPTKMHRENPYALKKPDFAELGKKYEFLAPYVTTSNDKGHINFKNKDALRALSRALLLEDFGLDIVIPMDVLVPAVPQRLNYIMWIDEVFKGKQDIYGFDIGMGATCIYPLLGAKKYNWTMVGTDVVQEYVTTARENIERNNLNDLVQVRLLEKSDGFFSWMVRERVMVDFTMCNPPFFDSDVESCSMSKSRTSLRSQPSAAKTGSSHELVVDGGEMKFISDMIIESEEVSYLVRIFTTMVGIKAHLKDLVKLVKDTGALGYSTTRFVQGKTMRWGLAWTFNAGDAALLADEKSVVQAKFECKCSYMKFVSNIKTLLKGLQFRFVEETEDWISVEALTNTWSHQRRKRRAAMKKQLEKDAGVDAKQIKTQGEDEIPLDAEEANASTEPQAVASGSDGEVEPILGLEIWFEESDNGKELHAVQRGGSLGVDAIHQIIQYFRNMYNNHQCEPEGVELPQ